ncbi:MAG: 4-phosphoerythronate dehydrogenase [Pseudohongiellaceae bacterium]|nr:4-phosphoerythronate dehydrogenase [Pseudohongiellaceae bacterium]
MKIVADANIIDVQTLYETHGELHLLPGREIRPEDVRDAQVLIVRSITKVNEKLLGHSDVELVLSATSGTDHIDLDYLAHRGIHFEDAAGSNANAVVEYCLSAMAELRLSRQFDWTNKRVGIIGYGNVGSRLYRVLSAMGVECVACDPFVESKTALDEAGGRPQFCSFEQALSCDVVSLHTPLSTTGEYPTHYMINDNTLKLLKPDALLMNASRGAVVDNEALFQHLKSQPHMLSVLDVWENEPLILGRLLDIVTIATPHIAGYSVEAKKKASAMNYESFKRFYGLLDEEPGAVAANTLRAIDCAALLDTGDSVYQQLAKVLRATFSITDVDRQLRECGASNGAGFDAIRKAMADRREFSHVQLGNSAMLRPETREILTNLDFALA